jgi:hypothetical protein
VGPFQHPGGGVFGAGRAAAMKMMADLRISASAVAGSALRRVLEYAVSRAFRRAART